MNIISYSPLQTTQYAVIGFGTAGAMHSKLYEKKGFIEIDEKKIKGLLEQKQTVFSSYIEADKISQIFDVCVPTGEHLKVLEKIADINPKAKVIVEKPVCDFEQIADLVKFKKKYPKLKICVQENYRASETTLKLADKAKKIFKKIEAIKVISIKNRIPDFEQGRYVDPLGVWGYEGSHIQTIFDMFCKIVGISNHANHLEATFTPLNLKNVDESKFKQGGSEVTFTTDDKIKVVFHTCMTGKIKYPLCNFPIGNPEILEDPKRKYRVFAVEGIMQEDTKGTLIAFYDKVDGLDQLQSVIYLMDEKGNFTRIDEPFEDNTLKANLESCTRYLLDETGEIPNPSPVEEAIILIEKIQGFNLAEKK